MTGQIVYVSATPAEFEIKNSMVGNTGIFRTSGRGSVRRSRCRSCCRAMTGNRSRVLCRRAFDGAIGEDVVPISRTDEPPEQFDVHTPGAPLVVEQIIRPTGLLDPKITLRPLKHQIDETLELCRQRVEKQRAGSDHHADQTHGGGSFRLSARCWTEGALSAQRHRHDRARGNSAGVARGGFRHSRRDQSASRRTRPAGSLARLHSRCGQGRLSALANFAHSNRRPRRAACQWRGRSCSPTP